MHPRLRFLSLTTTTLILSLIFSSLSFVFRSSPLLAQAQSVVAALPDGKYQFCNQPEAKDTPYGAGVCFWFRKVNNRVVGNYGYPQSDAFLCVSGEVQGNLTEGEALAVSWSGDPWNGIPPSPFKWDEEGHLELSQGSIIHSSGDEPERTDWIQFRTAVLDLNGFYRYYDGYVEGSKIPESCSVEGVTATY